MRLVGSEDDHGYLASKKRYFYGLRVQLLCTRAGLPVEFVFLPGEANDTRGLSALPLNLPAGSQVYSDVGYTDYQAEDDLKQTAAITLQVMRKRHVKRPAAFWVADIKQHHRHPIETIFSSSTQRFPKSIHAVTMNGFLLKVTAFILAFTLEATFMA